MDLQSIPLLFGFLYATIHVVTGPDHLAAVGPIAISARNRSWLVGMAWGIGHIFGMLLIGLLFMLFREVINIELISEKSEFLVGFLLIGIGCWAFLRFRTSQKKRKKANLHLHTHQDGKHYAHFHTSKGGHSHEYKGKQSIIVSVGIGIFHGLAGVSHLIGLLPTLAFGSKFESIQYLTGFGIGTIASMVIFSFILGLIGHYANKNRVKLAGILNISAGSIAIIVGFFWIWSGFQL